MRGSKTIIGVTCKDCVKKGVELIHVDSDGNRSEMRIKDGKATYYTILSR